MGENDRKVFWITEKPDSNLRAGDERYRTPSSPKGREQGTNDRGAPQAHAATLVKKGARNRSGTRERNDRRGAACAG